MLLSCFNYFCCHFYFILTEKHKHKLVQYISIRRFSAKTDIFNNGISAQVLQNSTCFHKLFIHIEILHATEYKAHILTQNSSMMPKLDLYFWWRKELCLSNVHTKLITIWKCCGWLQEHCFGSSGWLLHGFLLAQVKTVHAKVSLISGFWIWLGSLLPY